MKRIKLISLIVISMAIVFSCDKDPDILPKPDDSGEVTPGGNGEDDPAPGGDEEKTYTPEESKAVVEDALIKLSDFINEDDLEKINDFASNVSETISNSNKENLEEWAAEALEKIQKCSEYYATKSFVYEVNDFEALYSLSAFSGHFELVGNDWICTEADDLALKMKDNQGKDCEVTLVGSGKETLVMISDAASSGEYGGYDVNGDGVIDAYEGFYNDDGDFVIGYSESSKISVLIPEKIDLVAKYGSEQYVNLHLNTEFKVDGALEIGDYDLNVPAINTAIASISGTVSLLDYKLDLSELSLKSGNGVFSANFCKGSENLISAQINMDGFKVIDNVDKDVEMDKVTLKIDVVGDLQIDGVINSDALKSVYIDPYSESEVKNYVDLLNKNTDIGVYFGTQTRQASIKFVPYYDEGCWDYNAVIAFEDGTTYSFEEYFDEGHFATLIEKLDDLMELFSSVIDVESEPR